MSFDLEHSSGDPGSEALPPVAESPACRDPVPAASQTVRQEAAGVLPTAPERIPRMYTSDEIDRGFGYNFHPVTGSWINGAPYNESAHQFAVVHKSVGFGEHGSRSEVLPRIGDGQPHVETEFPLPHWKCSPRTGLPFDLTSRV